MLRTLLLFCDNSNLKRPLNARSPPEYTRFTSNFFLNFIKKTDEMVEEDVPYHHQHHNYNQTLFLTSELGGFRQYGPKVNINFC